MEPTTTGVVVGVAAVGAAAAAVLRVLIDEKENIEQFEHFAKVIRNQLSIARFQGEDELGAKRES